jgi:hypothetical protein
MNAFIFNDSVGAFPRDMVMNNKHKCVFCILNLTCMISLFGHEFSDSAQATRAKAQDVFLEFSYSSCFK